MKCCEWLEYLNRRFWHDVMDKQQVRKTRPPLFFREQEWKLN